MFPFDLAVFEQRPTESHEHRSTSHAYSKTHIPSIRSHPSSYRQRHHRIGVSQTPPASKSPKQQVGTHQWTIVLFPDILNSKVYAA